MCLLFSPPAWMYGDPHFSTLDGRDYTFNGHGEYVLVQDVDLAFQIQCRTDRALTTGGNVTDATVFTAFALQGAGAWLQAELNDNKDGINVFAGRNRTSWSDFTADFNSGDFVSQDIDGLLMVRDNNTLTAMFTDLGD